jgi:hypothetical protein
LLLPDIQRRNVQPRRKKVTRAAKRRKAVSSQNSPAVATTSEAATTVLTQVDHHRADPSGSTQRTHKIHHVFQKLCSIPAVWKLIHKWMINRRLKFGIMNMSNLMHLFQGKGTVISSYHFGM